MKTKIMYMLGVLFILTFMAGSGCIANGGGSASDRIQGTEYSGWPKTYKVWLENDQGLPGVWSGTFSADPDDKELIQKIEAARSSQHKVNVTYVEYLVENPLKYASKSVIVDISPLNNTSTV